MNVWIVTEHNNGEVRGAYTTEKKALHGRAVLLHTMELFLREPQEIVLNDATIIGENSESQDEGGAV